MFPVLEIAPEPKNVKSVSIVIHNKPLLITPEFVLMRRLLESPKYWGLVDKDTNLVIRELDFKAPLPRPPGKGEGLEIDFNHPWTMI